MCIEDSLPGATCILAPVSDCSLLICSPPRPMTDRDTNKSLESSQKKSNEQLLYLQL